VIGFELVGRLVVEGLVDPDRIVERGDVLEDAPPGGFEVWQHGVVGPFVLE
jgi:hypothetical protein